MCKDCGCSIPRAGHVHSHEHEHDHAHPHELSTNPQLNDKTTLSVIHKILDKNDVEAAHNRSHFESHGVMAFNLMSSPGSGKTTLLEHLQSFTNKRYCVIEGDLETSRDADRLKARGISAVQIQTGSACHLDAFMVHGALHQQPLDNMDICFIENVGNLVCPASYDVGSHKNVVLVSVPEGEDKIEKYPVMFRKADLVLITKCDLLPYFDFDPEVAKNQVLKLNPNAKVFCVSVKEDDTMTDLAHWLENELAAFNTAVESA